MDKIEWLQVLVAFFLGVMFSAATKKLLAHLRGQAASAIG